MATIWYHRNKLEVQDEQPAQELQLKRTHVTLITPPQKFRKSRNRFEKLSHIDIPVPCDINEFTEEVLRCGMTTSFCILLSRKDLFSVASIWECYASYAHRQKANPRIHTFPRQKLAHTVPGPNRNNHQRRYTQDACWSRVDKRRQLVLRSHDRDADTV